MSDGDNIVGALVAEMERVFAPVLQAAESPYARARLFETLGWDGVVVVTGGVEQTIDAIGQTVRAVIALAKGDLTDFGKLLDAIQAVGNLISALDQLGEVIESGILQALARPEVIRELAEDLYTHLVCTYLIRYHPWAYLGSVGLTLIDPSAPPRSQILLPSGALVRRPVRRRELRFDNLPRLFQDPVGHLKAFHFDGALDAAGARYFSDRVLAEVASTLALHDISASYGFPTELARQLGLDPQDEFVERVLSLGFRFPRVELAAGTSAGAELAVSMGLLGNDEGGPAVVLIPAGAVDVAHTIEDWTISIGLAGGSGGIALGPGGVTLAQGIAAASGRLELDVSKGGAGAAAPAFMFGGSEGTRLELGGVYFRAGVDLSAAGAGFDLEAGVTSAQIVVAAGDGDGFLQQILPKEGFRVPFQMAVGFVSPNRIYFVGGAALDVELPVNVDLFGVIKIPVIGLRMALTVPEGQPPALHAAATATVDVAIGPFFATVEGMGLGIDVTFPAGGGNLGPAQFTLGFEPPRGVGIRINGGPVTGGGYLFLDFANREYSGVLQLKIGPLGLTAVGLLTTRMPDGSDGFSMVLIISADFPPVQLSFGFTLNGAGGLLGVNRTVNVPALQDGVRRGALDSILFPRDAVSNARRIISDVGLIFPPAGGQFVLGPLVKLGWGTPPIITAAIGVVLEFPRFTISLLGLIEVGLPTLAAPVVLLRLAVAGVVDPGRGELSIDATLMGSYVAVFSISGDMAVRLRWKGQSLFAIAAGGFHPRFEPPAGFPALNRLAIALADSDNPRLRLDAYLAITPATVQLGANLDLYAKADFGMVGKFEVSAGLGFDTLIGLTPFSLEVDVYGHADIRRNGAPLCGADVAMRLTGPSPWHGVGAAVVHFFGDHTIRFELTVGESAPTPALPAVDLAAAVRAAFGNVAGWTALPPADAPVRLRGGDSADGALLVHPSSDLVLRQSVAPLDRDVAKAGTAPIDGARRLHLDGILVGPDDAATMLPAGAAVTDLFAPSQFFELSDDARLTGPQFEPLPSGAQVSTGVTAWGGTATLSDSIEEIVVDAEDRTTAVVQPLGMVGKVAADAVARNRGLVSRGRSVLGVSVKEASWAAASTVDATATGLTASAGRYSTWIDAVTSTEVAVPTASGARRVAVSVAEVGA